MPYGSRPKNGQIVVQMEKNVSVENYDDEIPYFVAYVGNPRGGEDNLFEYLANFVGG